MLRNGLSYEQAMNNCNRIAKAAYVKAELAGKSVYDCQESARLAYEKEMNWYERK